ERLRSFNDASDDASGKTRDGSSDSGSVPRECSPWTGEWTLEAPRIVEDLEGANHFFSPDSLAVFYSVIRVDGVGMEDIYVAKRVARDDPFGHGELVAGVNTANDESGFVVTSDGLEAFIVSDVPGGAGYHDIWTLRRRNTSVPFSNPMPVSALN